MEVRLQQSISKQLLFQSTNPNVFSYQIEKFDPGNCIKGGQILLGYHISIELQSLLHQNSQISRRR